MESLLMKLWKTPSSTCSVPFSKLSHVFKNSYFRARHIFCVRVNELSFTTPCPLLCFVLHTNWQNIKLGAFWGQNLLWPGRSCNVQISTVKLKWTTHLPIASHDLAQSRFSQTQNLLHASNCRRSCFAQGCSNKESLMPLLFWHCGKLISHPALTWLWLRRLSLSLEHDPYMTQEYLPLPCICIHKLHKRFLNA